MKKILIALVLMFVLTISVNAFWPFTKSSLSPPTFPSKTLSCEDSDNGQLTNVSGAIQYTWKQGKIIRTSVPIADSCEVDSKILEVYCSGKIPKYSSIPFDSTLYRCDAGTINAFEQDVNSAKLVAISSTPAENTNCIDSDQGIFPTIAGIVYGTDSQAFAEGDRCDTNNNLLELSCKDRTFTSSKIKCKGDVAGKCVATNITVNGKNYSSALCQAQPFSCNENGSVVTAIINAIGTLDIKTDKCEGNKFINYSCVSNTEESITTNITICENGCNSETGACLVDSVCSDSDAGGKDYNTLGTIITPYATEVRDFCYSNKGLVEFSCKDNAKSSKTDNRIYFKKMNCKNGCLNGACVARQIEGVSQPLEQ